VIGAASIVNLQYEPLAVWHGANGRCSHFDCYFEGFPRQCSDKALPLPDARRERLAAVVQAKTIQEAGSFARFAKIAATMAQLLRPSRRVRYLLAKAKSALGWTPDGQSSRPPLIGLHVRDGDSCASFEQSKTHRTCGGLEEAMPWLRTLATKYGSTAVFLATDGAGVINETARYPEFQWLFLRNSMRFSAEPTEAHNPTTQRMESRVAGGALDGESVAMQSLVDMLLLSETDVLVGKFTSNLFRAALEYRGGQLGGLPAFVSLDATWCFGFRGTIVRGPHAGEKYVC